MHHTAAHCHPLCELMRSLSECVCMSERGSGTGQMYYLFIQTQRLEQAVVLGCTLGED